jgi:hypothetical protein
MVSAIALQSREGQRRKSGAVDHRATDGLKPGEYAALSLIRLSAPSPAKREKRIGMSFGQHRRERYADHSRQSADGIRNEFGPDRWPWKNDVMLMMYAHRLSNADGMCRRRAVP